MARSQNWQQVQQQHKIYKEKDKQRQNWDYRAEDNAALRRNQLWSVKGKHYGKHLNELPLNYLGWIIDNFENESLHRQIAAAELQRRYKELGK